MDPVQSDSRVSSPQRRGLVIRRLHTETKRSLPNNHGKTKKIEWKRDLTNRANGTLDPWYGCDLFGEMWDYAFNFTYPSGWSMHQLFTATTAHTDTTRSREWPR